MKVLLVNGSPHKEGGTYMALCRVSEALNEEGIDTDVFWVGDKPLSGCTGCGRCEGMRRCGFSDPVNDFLDIAGDYNGFVFGAPDSQGEAADGMSIISSLDWNVIQGSGPEKAEKGPGGTADMEIIGRNMAYFLQCRDMATRLGLPRPKQEVS